MKNSAIYAGGEGFDRFFKALGDPHRIRILELLRERELSAGEILEAIDVVQSTLSHHMKTLSDAGAVIAVRRGKWTYYSLNGAMLEEASAFLKIYAEGTRERRPETEAAHAEFGAAVKEEKQAGAVGKTGGKRTEEAAGRDGGKVTEKAAGKTGRKRTEDADGRQGETPASKSAQKAAADASVKDAEKSGRKKDKKNKKNKKKKGW